MSLAVANGALGARLTGAGWGGCAVFLIQDENADLFIEQMTKLYFEKRIQNGTVRQETFLLI